MYPLQLKSKLDSNNPNHIYYNLNVINYTKDQGTAVPLVFKETRTTPYLLAPSRYYISVIRFNIKIGKSIPVFIPLIQTEQSDPNLTIYRIVMKNSSGNYGSQYIYYSPSDSSQPIPQPPLEKIDFTSSYYWIQTYNEWIYMVNQALSALSASLAMDAPFMSYDNKTSFFSLYIPASWTSEQLFFDNHLANMFDSLPMRKTLVPAIAPFASMYMYQPYSLFENFLNQITLNNTLYNKYEQEYSTIALLNPVKSIVFSSSMFPVVFSNLSVPQVYGSEGVLKNSANNSNIQNIITDFEIPVGAGNFYKESIFYEPSGEYRMFDIYGSEALNELVLYVGWNDYWGNTYPVMLQNSNSADLLIMFRSKQYNNIDLSNP